MFGIHTCNKRQTRSYIQQTFPKYIIEDGFTEEDELWKSDIREAWADADVRAKAISDMVFENDKDHCKDHQLFLFQENEGADEI